MAPAPKPATPASDAPTTSDGAPADGGGRPPVQAAAVAPIAERLTPPAPTPKPASAPRAAPAPAAPAFAEARLPASFGAGEGDGPQSMPALLLEASRSAQRADRPVADEVRGEIDDDPIDEAPRWAEGDADPIEAPVAEVPVAAEVPSAEPLPAVDPVVAAVPLVDPAELPMGLPMPVIEPWADREPVAEAVAPAAEPSSHRISKPASPGPRSRAKSKLTPRLVPSLLEADAEPITVGASPLFWEARPERAAPMLPTLRRYVPPTPVLPAHHHDFDGVVGDRLEALEPDDVPVVHATVHSGLLLTAADVDSGDEVLDRGDMGEGRIGQTLEGARVHGIEVIHAHRFGPQATTVDHLVISANGVWVVHAVDALLGPLERRDVGDWFRKDQRLYIDDAERTDLLDEARRRAAVIVEALDGSPFAELVVHPVLCFGTVQPAWVDEPFHLDGVSVTWRRHLVEPMLTPVLLDVETRSALTRWFATAAA
ncbi:hypothetical protein BH10ACT1_BH10ACT1_27750 [soil metagenome]